MPRSAADNARQYRYNEKHLKRIPLDVQKIYYDEVIKPAAAAAGVGVNTYIKEAIAEKIARDNSGAASDPSSV